MIEDIGRRLLEGGLHSFFALLGLVSSYLAMADGWSPEFVASLIILIFLFVCLACRAFYLARQGVLMRRERNMTGRMLREGL